MTSLKVLRTQEAFFPAVLSQITTAVVCFQRKHIKKAFIIAFLSFILLSPPPSSNICCAEMMVEISRVTFFSELSQILIALRLFLVLILTVLGWLQRAGNTFTGVSSISWLHVKFPVSRWSVSSGGWNTSRNFQNTVKKLQQSSSSQCFCMSCSRWCNTKTVSSSGMLNDLTRNNTPTSGEPSTKYQEGGKEVIGS